jgi:DNA polymerase
MNKVKTLEFLTEAGVAELVTDKPRSYFETPQTKINNELVAKPQRIDVKPVQPAPAQPVSMVKMSSSSLTESINEARKLADNAKTLAELRAAVEGFNGLAIKKTANKTVFCDGNPDTGVMLIGEAPGADEDVKGIPFCGMSGQLLDKVLWSIRLDRKNGFYITNTLFWRPPGNRKPTPEELAVCEPFLEKHIALAKPKILLLVGATAVQGILKNNDSMGKLRGNAFNYRNQYMDYDCKVMVTYHPSFLLRSPLNKRLAWEDMLTFKQKIAEIKSA